MKRILAFLGVALGGLGLLASVAGVVLVWWFSARYLTQVAETARAVESLLSSAAGRFSGLDAGVQQTGKQVADLRTAAHAVAQQGNKADPEYRARIERLL